VWKDTQAQNVLQKLILTTLNFYLNSALFENGWKYRKILKFEPLALHFGVLSGMTISFKLLRKKFGCSILGWVAFLR